MYTLLKLHSSPLFKPTKIEIHNQFQPSCKSQRSLNNPLRASENKTNPKLAHPLPQLDKTPDICQL